MKLVKNLINLLVNKHLNITRGFMMLVAIALIALLFPRSNFKYDFEEGKPWAYEDLNAPYAFSIIKSAAELEAEEEKIQSNFIPSYIYIDSIADQQIRSFEQNFINYCAKTRQDTLILAINEADSLYALKQGREMLRSIYNKGVIQWNESHLIEPQPPSVLVQRDSISVQQKRNQIFDNGQAFKYLLDETQKDERLSPEIFIPLIKDQIESNILYNQKTSERVLNEELKNILPFRDKVQSGEKIVANGQLVNKDIYQKLLSLKQTLDIEEKSSGLTQLWTYIGYCIVTGLIMFLFLLFSIRFRPSIFKRLSELTFILSLICLFLLLVRSVVDIGESNFLYLIPFCVVPIVLRNFFGPLISLLVYMLLLILSGFIIPNNFDFLFLQFVAGLVAMLTSANTYYWSQFFSAVGFIFLTYCIGYIGLSLIQNNSIRELDYTVFGPFILNALLTLLAFPLIPLFERVFGFISNLTLVELSDVNKPLLKELAEKAPGSFWHSQQVASLAEKAANAIHANALLAKVGALYHDVGKMERPIFFIENQNVEINPHDDLEPLESAEIIIGHVTKGISIAKKYRIPNIIIDFIRTHHGTTTVAYFMRQYQEQHPEEIVDKKLFQYPGPTPYSKETALVMIADSVEAASMSLKNPSNQQIDDLVDNIIQGKIAAGQFVNCDLSFKDLKIISKTFKKLLKSKYHIRIEY